MKNNNNVITKQNSKYKVITKLFIYYIVITFSVSSFALTFHSPLIEGSLVYGTLEPEEQLFIENQYLNIGNSNKDLFQIQIKHIGDNKYNIMTKAEIVNEVAKATGIEKIAVQTVVESFMECVKDSLAKGNPVYLRGFGSFIIKHRAQKAARNITKKTTMTIPAHDIPAFKPAKVFLATIKK